MQVIRKLFFLFSLDLHSDGAHEGESCRLSTVSFSEDSSIMAAGFGESYIRLWSLTGKGLKQLRTDLKGDEVGKIHDGTYHQLFPSLSRELTSKLAGVPSC